MFEVRDRLTGQAQGFVQLRALMQGFRMKGKGRQQRVEIFECLFPAVKRPADFATKQVGFGLIGDPRGKRVTAQKAVQRR